MHICYDLLVRPFSFIFSEYWDISTQGCVGSAIQYRPIHKILNNMIAISNQLLKDRHDADHNFDPINPTLR